MPQLANLKLPMQPLEFSFSSDPFMLSVDVSGLVPVEVCPHPPLLCRGCINLFLQRGLAPMRRAINAESPGKPFSGLPGDSREKMGGDLLSRLSRQYHRRGRA